MLAVSYLGILFCQASTVLCPLSTFLLLGQLVYLSTPLDVQSSSWTSSLKLVSFNMNTYNTHLFVPPVSSALLLYTASVGQ